MSNPLRKRIPSWQKHPRNMKKVVGHEIDVEVNGKRMKQKSFNPLLLHNFTITPYSKRTNTVGVSLTDDINEDDALLNHIARRDAEIPDLFNNILINP